MGDFLFSRALCFLLCLFVGVSAEIPHYRRYFFAGGKYVTVGSGDYLINQMYVEELKPLLVLKQNPIVFVHGLGQTGTNWLNTPDGRQGWASYFLARGYVVYLVDTPDRARSTWNPVENTTLVPFSAAVFSTRFTAPEKFPITPSYPNAADHTQWPGTGLKGDPIFDQYFASTVPSIMDLASAQHTLQDAGAALLTKIGKKCILIGHSQGAFGPWVMADAAPQFVHSIVVLEAAGPPFVEPAVNGGGPARMWGVTDIPLTYDPPVTDPATQIFKKIIPPTSPEQIECTIQDESQGPPKQLKNLAMVEGGVLVVTSQASWHIQYDWCTAKFLNQAGVAARHVLLSDHNINGNGHMLQLEKNSDDIANIIRLWLDGNLQ
ncbi:uncharacterized protein BP5553_09540 [Venustampulla echinocandica]|uniref:AB hydrolase-1 domain-containing protein n=1 Tax=Venustampulla echinocandica TaxID=2656787 RepID=A0A370TB99_9HELO|nr:uncharacterized protein BP5553_09540 [Venustampulla echinocandica]RDL31331.1 hypothetical protein BP5553_09540 [Venustampulla echinocandica]